jgi:hypothetical protein
MNCWPESNDLRCRPHPDMVNGSVGLSTRAQAPYKLSTCVPCCFKFASRLGLISWCNPITFQPILGSHDICPSFFLLARGPTDPWSAQCSAAIRVSRRAARLVRCVCVIDWPGALNAPSSFTGNLPVHHVAQSSDGRSQSPSHPPMPLGLSVLQNNTTSCKGAWVHSALLVGALSSASSALHSRSGEFSEK